MNIAGKFKILRANFDLRLKLIKFSDKYISTQNIDEIALF